ncbi:hypothetical protein BGE01nite_55160 [Brevifollis gellanilyticus]|uniref:Uncharacterized protein n=1 Tax=Brevifollis gellanilyticus TaxID=748831 RepID=A0A512MHK4_9BACT|nr:hypothetical protein BGE01nite_55160 [Brevifollis gellanilyticus]
MEYVAEMAVISPVGGSLKRNQTVISLSEIVSCGALKKCTNARAIKETSASSGTRLSDAYRADLALAGEVIEVAA